MKKCAIIVSKEKKIPNHPGLYWRDKRIWMRYSDANHKWVRESTRKGNITDAQKILNNRKDMAQQGIFPILLDRKKIKFAMFKDDYLTWKKIKKPRSHAFYNHIIEQLNKFFANYYLDKIDDDVVLTYELQQRATDAKFRGKIASPATVNRKIAVLRNVLNYAVDKKHLTKNPVEDWKKFFETEPQPQYIFSDREIDTLLAESTPPLQWFIILAINTGCRLREITELPWHEVDIDRQTITLNAKRTKGKRSRSISMNTTVFNLLSELKLKAAQGAEFVFPNPDTGKPYTQPSHAWWLLLKKCNIQAPAGESGPRFHDLRHTAATIMAMNGAPQTVIRDVLGHKRSSTTDRYMASTDAARKAALNGLQRSIPAGEIVELTKVAK